ncbi:ankyrin repeat-containing protein [Fusarium subglutinans]|uniref:Ankyrin repeat-containing protein n=1 Tax=Gibberella subglutinans TaxID=42677 RepID=A0A8H5UUB2_GIBSU|nr:ankyrin repeat-containing protein [Fusarium subglutinans]KAF5597635.1 ankyrin repeat-containing protein [Fusarium subglutinans]
MAGSPDKTSSQQDKGWTPLMCAAESGDIDTLTAHVTDSRDIDIDARDYDGCTSLAIAAEKGRTAVVERLLEHGAEPNLSDLDQITPLRQAARYGHASVVQLLLTNEKLSDVNQRPAQKYKLETPLSIAIKKGHQETAELLSRADGINPCLTTDLNKGSWEEISILGLAIRGGFEDMALSLLDKCDIGHDSRDTIEPASKLLVFAVAAGCPRIVQELLTKHSPDGKIEVGYRNEKGRTALSFAAERGFEAVVDELLATGAADPNSRDSRTRTPLIWATNPGWRYRPGGWQSHEGVTRKLLADRRIAVNAKDSTGRTALLYAAQDGALGLVTTLLEHPQIDPTAGPEDMPPLLEASRGHADVVQALLSSGRVDVNTVMARGYERTALMAVVEYGEVEYKGATEVLISTSGIDVNFQDRDGRTALMLAVSGGTVGMVKQILAAGGDPNMQDSNGNTALRIKPDLPNNMGRTALSLAAEVGEIDCINALLARDDVNPDSRDINGRGPLSWVFGEVRLLRIPNIDPNAEDHDGFTPLLLAIISDQGHEIIEQKESEVGGSPPYVALSYVWGKPKGNQQPSQRQKHPEDLDGKGGGTVEPAIEDAIQVTLELGYRYLWVDRYCIVQTGDEAIKQEQLRHMHLVYANAEVTLIAAAGEDSSAGLPGVPGRPRNQQPGALIQGHAVICIPPDPSLHIRSNSTWDTRGWTYQEGLLAGRRLYFSEYEISYECRHMLCREAIHLPRGLEQTIYGDKPRFMESFWMYQS